LWRDDGKEILLRKKCVVVLLWGLVGEDGYPRLWPIPPLSRHDIEYVDGESNVDDKRMHELNTYYSRRILRDYFPSESE
jgi:hypothetical protein